MDTPNATAPHLSPKQMRELLDRYRVTSGKGFRLADFDPNDTAGHLLTKSQAENILAQDVHRLAALQERLYAQDEWAVLCALQAMDAAGKDGTIKHVMTGVNPQGVQVTSFKAPGPEELAHDFLWRANRALPPRGHIGIFNRSHYEEVPWFASTPTCLNGSTCRRNCWASTCGTIGWRRSPASSNT
jgi:polyphosphate kinase 2 (PPK2 family)